ncbi:uncharacterized protein [Asterias amurensis]|uniref:uncharacterized protein n=1 Tax=Asterias amurensis TaxID=7602 RepID=UPI003AB3390E
MAELIQQVLEGARQIEMATANEMTSSGDLSSHDEMTSTNESFTKKRHSNHHVGPIDLSYEEDSQRRCKSFFKRRKTIFDKANQLTSICGASVSIKLKSQGGQVYEYSSGEFQLEGEPGVPLITVHPTPRGRPKSKKSSVEEEAAECQVISPTYEQANKKAPCAICKKKDSFMACQKAGCTFWAHARCLGFVALAPTDMSNVKFFCPKHIPSS